STPIAPPSRRRCSRNGCSPLSSMIIRMAGSPYSGKLATPAIITGPSSNDLLRTPRKGPPIRFHAQRSCYVLASVEVQTGRRTMNKMIRRNTFDSQAAKERCLRYRRRILDISQQVGALHIGSAYSCTEIVDCMYHGLMRRSLDGSSPDTFLMSKGHGCMIQYVILEEAGILSRQDLDDYCKPNGSLGFHSVYVPPAIHAPTGALGDGLAMAVGMALAESGRETDGIIYVVLSDGEVQEGSTWEAVMMASSLGCSNIVAAVDNNDFQSLGRTSVTHPSFYPLAEKFAAFGWETAEADGDDSDAIFGAISARSGKRPFMLCAKTVKGKGVSYMENVPIWHYRSPSKQEYQQAVVELERAVQ